MGNGGRKGDIVGILIGVFNGGILLFYLRECVYLSEGEGGVYFIYRRGTVF